MWTKVKLNKRDNSNKSNQKSTSKNNNTTTGNQSTSTVINVDQGIILGHILEMKDQLNDMNGRLDRGEKRLEKEDHKLYLLGDILHTYIENNGVKAEVKNKCKELYTKFKED